MLKHLALTRLWVLGLVLLVSACDKQPAPIVEQSPAPMVKPKYRYIVGSGDTLYSIAFISNTDVSELARLNEISEPYTIYVGQVLALRPSALPSQPARDNAADEQAPSIATATPNMTAPEAAKPVRQAATPPRSAPIPPPNKTIAKSDKGWVWPVEGNIVQKFSATTKGIDIAGESGTPIQASRSGVVVYTGNAIRGSGNMVIIKHDDRYLTAYAHLKRINVAEGQQVRQADTIGTMGRSDTTSDRLHFEVRDKGKPVNPLKFLNS